MKYLAKKRWLGMKEILILNKPTLKGGFKIRLKMKVIK